MQRRVSHIAMAPMNLCSSCPSALLVLPSNLLSFLAALACSFLSLLDKCLCSGRREGPTNFNQRGGSYKCTLKAKPGSSGKRFCYVNCCEINHFINETLIRVLCRCNCNPDTCGWAGGFLPAVHPPPPPSPPLVSLEDWLGGWEHCCRLRCELGDTAEAEMGSRLKD